MEQYGVEADLTTSAKSLAAGMPLSAVVGRKEIMDSVHASGIGGTYNGNPLSCAAALAVFEIFEEEQLLDKGKKLGAMLRESLLAMQRECDLVGDVRGLGPMVAMELVTDRKTKEPAAAETKALVKYCLDRGVIILACGAYGNIIRFLMPLVMTEAQLQQGIDVVREGLVAVRS